MEGVLCTPLNSICHRKGVTSIDSIVTTVVAVGQLLKGVQSTVEVNLEAQ